MTETHEGSSDQDFHDPTSEDPPSRDAVWWRLMRLGLLVGAIVLLGVTQGMSMLVIVAAIVIMIFLHELGHFVMARRAGMLVTEFFIGFGPRIFSFRRGETEYGLKVIPAGAYVRIIGMNSMEEVDPELESRTYRQKGFWDRMGVAVAGSAMHFIIAFALLFSLFVFIGAPSEDRWTVGDVTADSAAQKAGIQAGDELLAVGGEQVGSFDSFRTQMAEMDPGVVEFTIRRDDTTRSIPVDLSKRATIIGTVGEDIDLIDSGSGPYLAGLLPKGVAKAAGLRSGDQVVAINGTAIDTLADVNGAVALSREGRIEFNVIGETGARSTRNVDLGSAVDSMAPTSFLGVGEEPVMEPKSPINAIGDSAVSFARVTKASVVGIGRFIWPPNIVRFITDSVTGGEVEDRAEHPTPAASTALGSEANRPISIVGVAIIGSEISTYGIDGLIEFLALLNIFFGVFNLFPMLPFDGGHVVVAVYEKYKEMRRGSKERYMSDVSKMIPVVYVLVGVLVVVGLLAMFVDVTRGVSL